MIYLDNGATSFPKPPSVSEAVRYAMRTYAANAGRGSHRMSVMAAEALWRARERLSQLFGIPKPERLVFTLNCTDSLNMGLLGLLNAGDDLIISDMEHNSVYRPAVALKEKGVRTLFAESDAAGMVSMESVRQQITPRTRLICLQHASNVGGGINPIREIGEMAHENGILFMVDAAQTAGCVPIDVEKDHIDILAFPGHKGLLGPQGTGGLYVREGITLRPLRRGGTGSASESAEMPSFLPDRLESGTQNLPGIAGLSESTAWILKTGVPRILQHERMLLKRMMDKVYGMRGVTVLGPRDISKRTGVLSLAFDGRDAAEIADILDKRYGIAVRAGLHCAPLAAKRFGILETGSLRFSPGVFNLPRDIDYAMHALRESLFR